MAINYDHNVFTKIRLPTPNVPTVVYFDTLTHKLHFFSKELHGITDACELTTVTSWWITHTLEILLFRLITKFKI